MFELISHCYKNCFDGCDDFGLSFCLRGMTLCVLQLLSLSWVHLNVTVRTQYRLTHHSHQHSIFCYLPWIVYPKFQATPPWDHGFITWQFLFWTVNLPKFLYKIFIHGPWIMCLLAVVTKMPGLPNGFKMAPNHSVRKNWFGNCGVIGPTVSYIFLSDLSHQSY